jgi:CBS domain-containing protein
MLGEPASGPRVGPMRVGDVASRRLPVVRAGDTLARAAEVMLVNASGGVVVTDEHGRPVLALSYEGLVGAIAGGASVSDEVSRHATPEPLAVGEWASVSEAFELLRSGGSGFLPVVDASCRLVGTLEPSQAAPRLWEPLDYGVAGVEALAGGLTVLPGEARVREAARAMHSHRAREALVRLEGGGQALLRVEDLLRAVSEGRLDAPVAEYASGQVIRVPLGFDAKSAVELMVENSVGSLLVTLPEGPGLATLASLAFRAAELLSKRSSVEEGFVLIRVEGGLAPDLARRLVEEEGVAEAYLVAGEYDVVARVEAPGPRQLLDTLHRRIRRLPGVAEARLLPGVRVAARRGW